MDPGADKIDEAPRWPAGHSTDGPSCVAAVPPCAVEDCTHN
jgi:hypothetical protein